MSIETIKRVVCDMCGATGPAALESENPVEILPDGWQCNTDANYCPDCAKKRKATKHYTIIGFYEDNRQVWTDHYEAETPMQAAAQAVRNILSNNEWDGSCAVNIAVVEVVEVIEGDAECCCLTESVAYGNAILKLAEEELAGV